MNPPPQLWHRYGYVNKPRIGSQKTFRGAGYRQNRSDNYDLHARLESWWPRRSESPRCPLIPPHKILAAYAARLRRHIALGFLPLKLL